MRIGENLPEFFDKTGLKQMRRSLSKDLLYLAIKDGRVVGFVTIEEESKGAEISWLAVEPTQQGEGIGSNLLNFIEESLAGRGTKLLTVKTLAGESNYQPYEAARAFYERNGFDHIRTIHSYPDWDGDPAAVYMKELPIREAECN